MSTTSVSLGVILGVIGAIKVYRWFDVLVQLVVELYHHSQEVVEECENFPSVLIDDRVDVWTRHWYPYSFLKRMLLPLSFFD